MAIDGIVRAMEHNICDNCMIGRSLAINADEANQYALELYERVLAPELLRQHQAVKPLPERVVCDREGPSRFLGRCGAKRVSVAE